MNLPLCLRLSPVAALLIVGLIGGADVDRWYIGIALTLVLGMSAVPTYSKSGENIDA